MCLGCTQEGIKAVVDSLKGIFQLEQGARSIVPAVRQDRLGPHGDAEKEDDAKVWGKDSKAPKELAAGESSSGLGVFLPGVTPL